MQKDTQRGITLIETLVAVTILTFALGGPFALASQSLRAAGYAREEVVASRLAEEALEIVHGIRDNYSIDGDAWSSAGGNSWNVLKTSCASGNACVLVVGNQVAGGNGSNTSIWPSVSVQPCGSPTCGSPMKDVYLDSVSGVYAQFAAAPSSQWVKQPITRQIILTPVAISGGSETAEYTVTVTVDFRAGKLTKKLVVSDTIRNWFPGLWNGGIN